jgi:hypothetical protein
MPLVKVIRIGSKRTEMALERIATALEGIMLRLEPADFDKSHDPMEVTEVSEVTLPEEADESVGIEE